MTIVTATEARRTLDTLIEKTAESHEPIYITGKRTNAVLVSEEDWVDIRETLFQMQLAWVKEHLKTTRKKAAPAAAKKATRSKPTRISKP